MPGVGSVFGRRAVTLGLVLGLALHWGCSRVELTNKGAQVAASPGSPLDHGWNPDSCKSLDKLVGSSGEDVGAANRSTDALFGYAMNDLRNKAADLGANYVKHRAPRLSKEGTSATVTGTAYRCRKKAKPARAIAVGEAASAVVPAPAAPPPEHAAAVPEGAGGFRFGIEGERARQICERNQHVFSTTEERATCSGLPVDLGVRGEVSLVFCRDRLCEIEIVFAPEVDDFTRAHGHLRIELVERYGRPSSETVRTRDCPNELRNCVNDAWRWPTGHSVLLTTGASGERTALVLTYSSPERRDEKSPGPTL
jgi:hypothetical protein